MIPAFFISGILLLSSSPVAGMVNPASDSLGIESVQGRIVVLHKVDPKETLYSLARRYKTSVEEISKANPQAGSLEVGLVLKIPLQQVVHTVKAGETLFAIARLYEVPVATLRKLNALQSDGLSIGQRLMVQEAQTPAEVVKTSPPAKSGKIVAEPGETLYSLARKYEVTVQNLREWNSLTSDNLQVGQEIWVRKPTGSTSVTQVNREEPQRENNRTTQTGTQERLTERQTERVEDQRESKPQTPVVENTVTVVTPARNESEVTETGLAEAIKTGASNRKYLALHKTAPVGSILKVRNELNGREVFVRVVGKMQDIAQNQRLLIQISPAAYERLGAIDEQFRVTITYYK